MPLHPTPSRPATATPPRPHCPPELAHQHALLDENAVLSRALAAAQQRSLRQVAEHRHCCELLQGQLMQLRGQLLARDTTIAALRDDLRTLAAAVGSDWPPGGKALLVAHGGHHRP